MVSDDLAVYIATATNPTFAHVYLKTLPPGPDRAIGLIEYPGRPGEHDFGSAALKRERPRVQFIVRGDPNDVEEPARRAYALWKFIGAMPVPVEINNVMFHEIVAGAQPGWLKKDDDKRHCYVFSVEFYKNLSST